MAHTPDDGPSLEMPTFALRRGQKGRDPAPRVRRRTPTAAFGGLPAAATSGLVVGGLAVALTWLAGVGCEAVRGTSACGRGLGLLALIVIVTALAWVGGVLLRAAGVPHPWSTSLLAVAVLAVLVMVFLLDSLDEWWALVVVPVVAAIAYSASWWVTSSAEAHDGRPTHAT